MEIRKIIDQCPVLEDMFQTIPHHVAERCFVKRLKPRTIILSKDETIDDIYFVCRGSIRVISEFINGTIHGFAYVEPGDVIGAMELLSDHATSACTLETMTECQVLTMSNEDFMEWFESSHVFSKAVARMIARKFFPTSYDYGVVFKEEAVITLGRYIYKVVHGELVQKPSAELGMTRQFLGEELGISTRTVYRALKKLESMGALVIDKGVIKVNRGNEAVLIEWLKG